MEFLVESQLLTWFAKERLVLGREQDAKKYSYS